MNEINFNVEDIEQVDLSIGMGIKEIYPPIENLEVTPTKEQQVFNHENSYGYDEVVVEPIPDEYIIPDGTLDVDANGDVDVTMFRMARVGVYTPPTLQDKEITINENGTHDITYDEGYDGLNQVSVTVDAIENLDEELETYNTELTEQEITINDIVEILKTKAIGGGDEMVKYSTEEQVIGEWIDGRPIYRKTMIIDSIGNNVNTTFEYSGIENVDRIWINHGMSFINNNYESQSLNWFYTTSDFMRTWVNKNLNGVRMRVSADLTAFSGYIVLEYIKTTD